MPHQMSLFIKQHKYTSTFRKRVKINSNKIALSNAKQEQHRNRFKTEFMTDVNIFLNSS